MNEEKKNGESCCSGNKCCCAKKLMCLIMVILIFALGWFAGKVCGSGYCPFSKGKMCPMMMHGVPQNNQ